MKKIVPVMIVAFMFVLVGCTTDSNTPNDSSQTNGLNTDQSLAFSTYLASGFLSTTSSDGTTQTMVSPTLDETGVRFLTSSGDTSDTFEIDTELDEVNTYFNKLKVFMDEGLDNAINLEETDSTKDGYTHQVSYTIDEVTYTIHYSFVESFDGQAADNDTTTNPEDVIATTSEDDEEADQDNEDEEADQDNEAEEANQDNEAEQEFKLDGIMVIDGVEYTLVGANEIEGNESKMWFETIDQANTDNYVNVEMKEEAGEQKFEIETMIDGVLKTSELKFEEENDETKVELELDDNGRESSYEFKRETEDGEVVYKFEYEIAGAEGEVEIYEMIDEQGNVTYKYSIEEDGKRKEVERDDDDEDENDEDAEDVNYGITDQSIVAVV